MGIVANNAKATIRWATNVTIGPEGFFRIFAADNPGGAVNFAKPIIARPSAAWPKGCYPGGLGAGPLGAGGLGHGYRGFGLGNGPLGRGPLGRGCKMLKQTGPKMKDGLRKFCVVGYDAAGNADPAGDRTEGEITLAGTPEPPGIPTATWTAGTLTMEWNLSTDDSG